MDPQIQLFLTGLSMGLGTWVSTFLAWKIVVYIQRIISV